MKRTLIAVFALLFAAHTASAFSGGPPAGRAGDPPNNSNCTACHSSFPVNTGDGSLDITEIMEYTPGQSYDMTVTLEDAGQSRWGFQLIAKDGSNNPAGTLVVTDATNTQLSSGYLQHTSSGTQNGTQNGPVTWDFEWTAPMSGTGDVTFYVAGNAADGNFTTTGDYIYTIDMAMTEAAAGGPPEPFTLTSPADGTEFMPSDEVVFEWEASSDPDGGDVNYEIHIADNENFDDPMVHDTGTETSYTLTLSDDPEVGMWYWRVMATDDEGDETLSDDTWTINVNRLPGMFSLIDPADGAVLDDISTVDFDWEEADDPDGEDVTYTLHADTDDSFSDPMSFDAMGNSMIMVDVTNFEVGVEYYWRVMAMDENDNARLSGEVFSFTVNSTDVDENEGSLPSRFGIAAAYPNPFNPELSVRISVPKVQDVEVAVYDILGRQVTILHNGSLSAGSHTLTWRPNTAAGLYMVRAWNSEGSSDVKKVVYMK
ncbi:T9SS type A sorting domain-containing protein [bacterium]|nr:T9SS type A sorting domain-containing protein [bacterium]